MSFHLGLRFSSRGIDKSSEKALSGVIASIKASTTGLILVFPAGCILVAFCID